MDAKKLSEREFEISREQLEAAVKSVETYARSGVKLGRLVASKAKDGRTGLRVFGIEPAARCGLRLSDLVLSINQVPVTKQDALEQKRDAWLAADSIELELERDGQPLWLTYRVH